MRQSTLLVGVVKPSETFSRLVPRVFPPFQLFFFAALRFEVSWDAFEAAFFIRRGLDKDAEAFLRFEV